MRGSRSLGLLSALLLPLSAGAVTFTDVTVASGTDRILESGFWGVGVSIVDFDNDDDNDIFVADGPGLPVYLFRNDGNMQFTEIAQDVGLTLMMDTKGGVFGDYDNDGDLDLFITNWQQDDVLYRNDDGQFVDVTAAAGVTDPDGWSCGAAWGDYDDDGYLDLKVVKRSFEDFNILYHNEGNGTFLNVTDIVGVSDTTITFQPIFTDYDRDGDRDIFVSTDKDYGCHLFRNDDGVAFTDVAAEAGVEGNQLGAMGLAVGDFDLNTTMDIYITNIQTGNPLFVNHGDGSFTDEAEAYDVVVGQVGWGTDFLDVDQDGDEDLYVVNYQPFPGPGGINRLFLNEGPGVPFSEIGASAGVDDDGPGFGFAYGDLNGDGYLDLYVTNDYDVTCLYLNDGGSNNWLEVRLNGVVSNSYGIGAWVEIEHEGKIQHREIRAGCSYLSQAPPMAHFGLGTSPLVERVTVYWPSGAVNEWLDIAVNQRVTFEEDYSSSVGEPFTAPVALVRAHPNPFHPDVAISFDLHRAGPVRLSVFDASGRLVRGLSERSFDPGTHRVRWDGRDAAGRPVASGVYLLRLQAGGRSESLPLVLAR